MPATHQEAFLEDIVTNPADDAPRLIYADWLDDNGDSARAEFIRVQHELAMLSPTDPRGKRLFRRQDELLSIHESDWRADLPELDGVTWEGFSRGFVESVFVEDVPTFLTHANVLFAAAPVRRLHIGNIDSRTAHHLAGSSWLGQLEELNLRNAPLLGVGGVRALARSPHLAGLRVLLLHYGALGNEAIARLAESTRLAGLVELYLSGNDLADAGAIALGQSAAFPRLTDLDLRDNQIGDAGAQALAHHAAGASISTLYLVNNHIHTEGAEALAFSVSLPRLRSLYLNYNPIGNEGAVAFAQSPHHDALRELDLRHCQIRDEGARALAASPYLDNLETLWVGGNRIRLETLTLLRRRFGERVRF
jgi:uncharacterized protein (TIGR02996 family)